MKVGNVNLSKMNMMNKLLYATLSLASFLIVSCSSQNEITSDSSDKDKQLHVVIRASHNEVVNTRTEYDDINSAKLVVQWNSDKSDKIGVYTMGGLNNVTLNSMFTIQGELSTNGKSANFAGSLTIGNPDVDVTLYGYYPYSNTNISPVAIGIDLNNQQQNGITGKQSLAHLAAKDFLAATPITQKFNDGNNVVSQSFTPLLTIMSFEVTNPESTAITVSSVKLEAAGTINLTPFHTAGTVDITNSSFPINYSNTVASIEMTVVNGTIASSSSARFNMIMFPMSSSDKPDEFKLTVTTSDGKVYSQTKNAPINGFVKGKRYIMAANSLTEEVTNVLEVGDYYLNNGTILDKGTSLSDAQKASCVGIVYKVNSSSSGMVVSKNGSQSTMGWEPLGGWGVTNATSQTDGKANRTTIQLIPDWATKYPPFGYCATQATADGIDWYLPAKDELSQLYNAFNDYGKTAFNQLLLNAGGRELSGYFYWSSTEYDGGQAYAVEFQGSNPGWISYLSKYQGNACQVVPVFSF